MKPRVALVDAERGSARGLERLLLREGYRVLVYGSLGKFLDSLLKSPPDVLLMDMHLPGMEGREMFRVLRANARTRRMILVGLSGRAQSKDEAEAAFKAGADEYFLKPVAPDLLAVRLRSLLRRVPAAEGEETIEHAGVSVCPESRVCRVEGKEVRLTRLEFDLLLHFARNPNRALTRGNLIDALWKGDSSGGARAVDRHIHALRAKLGPSGALLETLVGVGYRFCDGVLSGSSK